jgi:hypothetical protein
VDQDQVARRLVALALVAGLLGGCADRPPARATGLGAGPVASPYRSYAPGQQWEEPPGWRLSLTGVRCGPTDQLAPGDTDAAHVCVVGVAFTNQTGTTRQFTADPGPTWRISATDGHGADFHGHARPVPDTPPGASGTTDLVFEVPEGFQLRQVLIAEAVVTLSS